MADLIHHYTDRLSAADIIRERVIRAYPLTLHCDMHARDKGRDTSPIVWFTRSAQPERTVTTKMMVAGWPMPPVGDLYRFSVLATYADVVPFPTQEFGEFLGCEAIWWQWVMATAYVGGSRWEDWRLVLRDVSLDDVVTIEVLDRRAGELIWRGAR